MKNTIALLYGGEGCEHEVSVSGHPVLKKAIMNSGFDVLSVYISKDGIWYIDGEDGKTAVFPSRSPHGCGLYSKEQGLISIAAAVPLLHGIGGEDGTVQGALTCSGIPYIGARLSCSTLCIDKVAAKLVASSLGIPVARHISFSKYISAHDALDVCREKIGYPMFIKPRELGSSVGAAEARNDCEFITNFKNAMLLGSCKVMVEELIESKRELECAFYSAGGRCEISGPGEILCSGTYGYEEKYAMGTRTTAVADVSDEVKDQLKKYNPALADAVGLRHLGRIDWFLTDRGLIFNEINTFPGMTPDSLYPRLLLSMGINLTDAVRGMIEDVLCS